MTIEYYEAADGWRWRLIARNGRIVADSGEAYASKSNVRRAFATIESAVYNESLVERVA